MTPRQRLINNVRIRLNRRAELYSRAPTNHTYNEIVEGVACKDPDTWDWYLNATDDQYYRLLRKAIRLHESDMSMMSMEASK
jgi:hypothetical protein